MKSSVFSDRENVHRHVTYTLEITTSDFSFNDLRAVMKRRVEIEVEVEFKTTD